MGGSTCRFRKKMKVIVDNKIPYIKGNIEKIAEEVVYLPGQAFTKEEVKDADALIVRTRTLCNKDLLEGSRVKFIATATIGFDHIDTAYCSEAGIAWTNCPGCNAGSVEQYVHASLLLLKHTRGWTWKRPLWALSVWDMWESVSSAWPKRWECVSY